MAETIKNMYNRSRLKRTNASLHREQPPVVVQYKMSLNLHKVFLARLITTPLEEVSLFLKEAVYTP